MTSLHHQTTRTPSARSHPRASQGKWLILSGGSVLAHVLVLSSLGSVQALSRLSSAPETSATPVDFVDLPSPESEPVGSASANHPLQSSAMTADTRPVSPVPAPASDPSDAFAQGDTADQAAGSMGVIAAHLPKAAPVQPPAVPAEPPMQTASSSPQPVPATPDSSESPVSPTASAPSPAATPSPRLAMAGRQSVPISPSPAPLITTEQIDVPIPDVSQTWTPPETPPSPAVTQAISIPSYLTASLTTDALPSPSEASSETAPEAEAEAVQPIMTSRIFSSNPALSPCPVRREAIAFLGQTVALQVTTDETGQVVETVTQTSSQNAAYDELATCLVKSWTFKPATQEGHAIANGLLVHITIDRS